MTDVSSQLLAEVDSTEPKLLALSDSEAAKPALPGGWSRKQLLGHLIDSAGNNHQRFVRGSLQDSLTLPGYDQNDWSRIQNPQEASWTLMVTLWAAYNRYLAHIIAGLPKDKLQVPCTIGDSDPVTLQFIVEDYLVHLRHHLAQL